MAVPAIVFVARDAIGVAGVIAYWRRNEAPVPKRARCRTSAVAATAAGATGRYTGVIAECISDSVLLNRWFNTRCDSIWVNPNRGSRMSCIPLLRFLPRNNTIVIFVLRAGRSISGEPARLAWARTWRWGRRRRRDISCGRRSYLTRHRTALRRAGIARRL